MPSHVLLLDEIPTGGTWFVTGGVAFHVDAADRIDFTDADAAPGEWITIGGGAGPRGQQHCGGFPAKVTGGTPGPDGKLQGGTIVGGKVAGKLGLHGKTTAEVASHLEKVNRHRDSGKSLAEAVKAADAERLATPVAESSPRTRETPNTERAPGWLTDSDRFSWKGGGVSATDGWAARSGQRYGASGIKSPATPHDAGPDHPEEGLVRTAKITANSPEVQGARAELYAMARQAGNQSDFYSGPVNTNLKLPAGQARLEAIRGMVGPWSGGEKHRVWAQVYRKIGSGEDPKAVTTAVIKDAQSGVKESHKRDEAEMWVHHAVGMAQQVLDKYKLPVLPRDPWLDNNDLKSGGPAPEGTDWQSFVSGIKGPEHSSYHAGSGWIGRHNGALVSSRAALNGGTIETHRVRFLDRDLLVTWGRGAAQDQRSGDLPEQWQVVHDKAVKKTDKNQSISLDGKGSSSNNIPVPPNVGGPEGGTKVEPIQEPGPFHYRADAELGPLAGMNLKNGVRINHPQAGDAISFDRTKHNGKDITPVVRLAGKPKFKAAWDAHQTAHESHQAAEAAALEAAVPGLDTLRDARDRQERHAHAFDRMMGNENNDGARFPTAPFGPSASELAQKHPRAALYLRAEDYSHAANHHKVRAGQRAMQLLRNGAPESEAKQVLKDWLPETAWEN